MKINKLAIAIVLSITTCVTSVSPALAVEVAGDGASTAVLGEDFNNEVIMEEEKTVDVSALGNSENNENEQEQEDQDNNPLDNLNEESDSANESDTVIISEEEVEEAASTESSAAEAIDETAIEANTAVETVPAEELDESKISSEAKAASVFAGGSGTESDPYKVSNAAQLDAVRYYPEKHFVQTSDIDLSGINWKPILDEEASSWGGYNGNGFSISNLTITSCNTGYIGVFGCAGYIDNLTVKNARIEITKNDGIDELCVGIIAGYAQLDHCSAQGRITVTIKDNSNCDIGGLAGSSPSVENSHSDVNINVTHNGSGICRIGGIAGTSLYGWINKSYSKGSITSSGKGSVRIGGILGESYANTNVSKCINYCNIESNGTNSNNSIAGIISRISLNGDPLVEYSVNFGDIKDSKKRVAYASGIGGNGQTSEFSIHECYSLGDIEGNSNSGRIYTADVMNANTAGNIGYGKAIVNGKIPTGGLLPSGYNGMNMSASDIRSSISNILTSCGCGWKEPRNRIVFTPKVILSTSTYVYNGKVRRPSVTVKKGNTKLAASNYTVTYASGRKNPGTYKVTVKLKGNYFGAKTVSFKIIPKTTAITSLKPASKKLTVKWKKQAAQVTGYQIQCATDSKFTKNKKTVTVKGATKTAKAITGLLGGKKYYVRIRTYKTVSGKNYYSTWSKLKAATVKK